MEESTGSLEEENIFALGTQVQAGLDDYRHEIQTVNFWKDKLNGYAHIEQSSLANSKEFMTKPKNVRRIRRPKSSVKKPQATIKEKKNTNRQRKFGSINKEIIRKYRAIKMSQGEDSQDSPNVEDKEMQMLINQEDWDSIHGLLMNCLKNEHDDLMKSDKDKIVTEYTDFRQTQEKANSRDNREENANGAGDGRGAADAKLTQYSWSYPNDFTTDDLGVLYDITMSGIDLEKNDDYNVNNATENGETNSIVDELCDLANQTSGVFTLSQVLGENTQRCSQTKQQKADNDMVSFKEYECLTVQDSCDSDCTENEITFDYIEKIREEKAESGTQQMPIELDSSNIIEIPNSSDDGGDDEGCILDELENSLPRNCREEVIEIANSSTCGDSDSDIILTGCPEGGTQPLPDLDNPEKDSELLIDEAACSYERMIVPTSSPASSPLGSQEFNVNDNNVIIRPLDRRAEEESGSLVEEPATVPSELVDEPVSATERVFVAVVDISKRMKHFEGWNVVMLKKQLGEWGIKNASKMGRKGLEETLANICKNISDEKWKWALGKFKTGEVMKFTEWENEHAEDINTDVLNETQMKKAIFEQVRLVLQQDQELYYDLLRYKPLNLNLVLRKLGETNDRKTVSDCLDELGICWTEVE